MNKIRRSFIKPFFSILLFILTGFNISCSDAINKMIRKEVRKNKSKTVLTAYYAGTQNQAQIFFLENSKFYLHWTGVFFSSEWWEGNYKRQNDTLFLEYMHEKRNYSLSDSLVIYRNHLIPRNKLATDSINIYKYFELVKLSKK
jgi:hypothetical protein